MKEKLILFPCNGNALEALDCINDTYELIGFVDDNVEKISTQVAGVTVYSRALFNEFPEAKVLAVPGSPTSYSQRKEVITSLHIDKNRFISLIHPSAIISKNADIGTNCLIMAGVIITSNAQLEDHVCVLPATVIHHDSLIKAYTLIGFNVTIAGHTTIHENCYIGSGSTIINTISIAPYTLVGIGSNVIRSIHQQRSKVGGNPARSL